MDEQLETSMDSGIESESQVETPVPDTASEPQDLNDAFKALIEKKHSVDQSPVDAGNDMQGGTEVSEPEPERTSTTEPVALVDNGGHGGSTAPTPKVDYDAYRGALIQSIDSQAVNNVRQHFEQNGFRKIQLNDLYEKDERTGHVSFKDPDHPGRYFNSRTEASAWVKDFNSDFDNEIRIATMQEKQRLMEENQSRFNLIDSATKIEKLDDFERDVLSSLISPYQVISNGQVVGFNCDMNAAIQQATAIASKAKSRYQTAQAKPAPVVKPTTDIKGHGSQSAAVSNEPKSLPEAMRMIAQGNISKKKGRK